MTDRNMGRMDRAEVQDLWNRRDHLSALEVRCLNELGWMHVALAEAQGELDQAKRSLSDATSRAEVAEAEAHRTHMEVRADYDKTVADAWRAEVAKEREYAEGLRQALMDALAGKPIRNADELIARGEHVVR